MKNRAIVFTLFLAVAGCFLWAVIQLFEVRFTRGDVYSPYSTLRTDPLGGKAFYESLVRLDDLQVSRNERLLEHFTPEGHGALFYVGVSEILWTERETQNLENFVKHGGRLILTFYPQNMNSALVSRPPRQNLKQTPTPTPSPSASAAEPEPLVKLISLRDLATRWEFKTGVKARLLEGSAKVQSGLKLDPEISWHSAFHFKDSGLVWKNVYAIGEWPVIIERTLGAGTIVLASDSYFLSNEAMERERCPRFLSWLIGANDRVIFDETHLGVSERPGVSTLMRRYHLGGLIAGLLLLAGLVVWKNASALIPQAGRGVENDEVVAGRDSFGGILNLLRRNVPAGKLVEVCLAEWTGPQSERVGRLKEKIARAQAIGGQPGEPVRVYNEISAAINERKWKPRN